MNFLTTHEYHGSISWGVKRILLSSSQKFTGQGSLLNSESTRGNSFSAFCQAVKALNLKCSCYGVDNFKGDPHSGFYDESVYLEINNYITENYGDLAQIMKMDFDEAVKHDFENWIKKMSNRGVILLHDTQVRRDEFGVWKLWEELSKRYPSLV